MATLLYRLGKFSTRRRWLVLGVWLILLAALGGGALAFKGTLGNSYNISGTPAQQAMTQIEQKIPAAGGVTGRIVFAVPEGHTLAEPAYQQAIAGMLAKTKELPGVQAVIDPMTAKTISPDRRVAFATVSFAGQDVTAVPVQTQQDIANLAGEYRTSGMEVELGGAAVKQSPSIGSTEVIGVVVALVVLLVTFGSVVAAGMPILTALIGVGVGMAGILWLSGAVQMSSTAPILALMLGLAVGIDYALFILSRHRKQVKEGMPIEESIARATGTAGTAVVFAGLTVVIALAALSVVGISFLTVMGLAAAATVAVAVLIAITLLPALMGFAGEKVLRRRDRAALRARSAAGESAALDAVAEGDRAVTPAAPKANRWGRFVTRRPALVLIVGVLGMGVLSIPVTHLQMGLPTDATASPDSTQRKAYDLLSEGFGPGFNGPLIVTVEPKSPAEMQQAMAATMAAVKAASDDVAYVAPGAVSADGTLGIVQVIPASGPSDERTHTLVNTLRDDAAHIGTTAGATVAVTGYTAIEIDVSAKLASALAPYLIIVIGLALILLLLAFRSLVVPLKAAIGFLLTIGVSFGAVVAVFQWGWLGALFGVQTAGPIISFLPIILIGILFGLAMDYEMFLVSGMREAHARGDDAKDAVVHGFSAGSRVVTAAALIMASVFAGFVLAPDSIIKSIGFALAIGVLVDAFVVRMTLVPAVMTLLGKAAWYLPKWLEKVLPHVDLEGERLQQRLDRDARDRAARELQPDPA